jgi:ribonuclease T1
MLTFAKSPSQQCLGPWLQTSLQKLALAFATASALALVPSLPAAARNVADAQTSTVALSDLPAEARQTEALIRSGGPFPHAKDGVVFGNRERILPRKERGYYREYTVRTPGARDRGARRIVCGGREPKAPEACYYTADHYASFRRIAQ